MLTISLHGIKTEAKIGLYPEEKIHGNHFETDVDVWVKTEEGKPFPFYDYALIHGIVADAFNKDVELLEQLVQEIYTNLKTTFPEAEKIKVAVRKLQPPLATDVRYSQVCYEGQFQKNIFVLKEPTLGSKGLTVCLYGILEMDYAVFGVNYASTDVDYCLTDTKYLLTEMDYALTEMNYCLTETNYP